MKAFWWMSGRDSILKDFEAFFMEHNIESTPRDIRLVEYAKRIDVVMEKCISKAQEIALGKNGSKCGLCIKVISDHGLALRYTLQKRKT